MRDWVSNVGDTYYCWLGRGRASLSDEVRDFQKVIERRRGADARGRGHLPDAVFACVGGGSNAIGIFNAFLQNRCRADRRRAGARGCALGIIRRRFAAVLLACSKALTATCCRMKNGQVSLTHSGLGRVSIMP